MLFHAVLALEALDTARSIDQPLLARVEGVTVRAYFDMQLTRRRASFKSVAARASYHTAPIPGMYFGFHYRLRC